MDGTYTPQLAPYVPSGGVVHNYSNQDGKRAPACEAILAILEGLAGTGAKIDSAAFALFDECGSLHSDENRPLARLGVDDATYLAQLLGWVKTNLAIGTNPARHRTGVGGLAKATDAYSSDTQIRCLCNQ